MINATSHTLKKIWTFFLFIFILITIILLTLLQGIRIENLQLPKIKVSQLYIKLDKKLIVRANTINIAIAGENQTSIAEVQSLLNKLPYLYALFDSISIQNLILDNKTIHFLYKNEVFYVDSDFLTVDAKLAPRENDLAVNIKQLILKDYQMEIKGNLVANLYKNEFNFQGVFSTFNIDGALNLKLEKQKLFYRLNTQKFTTLKPFMDFISEKVKLEPLIGEWIYKRIIAKEYQINNLEGVVNLKNKEFYPSLMKGQATVKDVVVKFDHNAPPARVKDLIVRLENNQLIFDTQTATYEGKDIGESEVYIYNLMTKGAGIIVDIKAYTTLDASIHKILKAFHINIPITQLSGKTNAHVTLDIGFLPIEVKSYTGSFEATDSTILLSNVPMYSKSATVTLDNGMVHVKSANLKYNTLFDIYTSGTFDTKKGIYTSNNLIQSLHVEFNKVQLLHVEDLNASAILKIDNNRSIITVDKFDTTLEFNKKTNKINVNNLSILYPYSPLMKMIKAKDGKVEIDTDDFKSYNVTANLKNFDLPLQKKSKKINEMNASITIDHDTLEITSDDKNINIKYQDGLKVTIKDYDVAFDSSELNSTVALEKISIVGMNSNIIDTNSSFKLPSDKFSFEVNHDSKTFNSHLNNQKISLVSNANKLYVTSENLSDTYLNSMMGKKVFKDGQFSINMYGKNYRQLEGTFLLKNATIKEMKFFNNLMAFINTIPSLVTLKNPGFNDEGYNVEKGLISFSKFDDIVTIKDIKLNGTSADIIGNGKMDLETGDININLKIAILKGASSVIKEIPLLGYIILGKDGKIYTSVTVKGTLENPNITTNIITDTAISPFKIIKRAFELPFKLFK
jgi:hypothetical protein